MDSFIMKQKVIGHGGLKFNIQSQIAKYYVFNRITYYSYVKKMMIIVAYTPIKYFSFW